MSKLPIGIRIERILQEEASANVPDDLNLWPRIREVAQTVGPYQSLIGETEGTEGREPGPLYPVPARSQASVTSGSDRRKVLPGIRRFRLNMASAMVALLALAALVIAFIAGLSFEASSSRTEEGVFLPPGKVRHMIYTGTYTVDGVVQPSESKQEEFWLTDGKSHPLMRTKVTMPHTATTWLDDNAYYEYEPDKGNQVRKYPYDPKYLAAVVPDPEIITKTLQMPGARLVGNDTLDGRPVVVVAVPNGPTRTITYWIDRQTNQILQIIVAPSESSTGPAEKVVNRIALNELIDRNDLPSDFFEFKLPPGAALVENPAFSTPTP